MTYVKILRTFRLAPYQVTSLPSEEPVMLSAAKHLSAHRDRPFAALRVTNSHPRRAARRDGYAGAHDFYAVASFFCDR
jgi:hypothetical protein